MNSRKSQSNRPLVISVVVGLTAELCFLLLSFVTALGICWDTSIAQLLFPFSFSLNPNHLEWGLLPLLLAILQYPLYGLATGYALKQKHSGRPVALVLVIVIALAHAFAIGVANQRVDHMWQERFGQIK
jgi:hypothetical protein